MTGATSPHAALTPRLLLVLTLLAAGVGPGFARAEDEADATLKPGAWAVGFDWIVDDAFYGTGSRFAYGINLKRHSSASTAFRVGLGFDFEESQREGITVDYDDFFPAPQAGDANSTRENQSGFVYAQLMAYRPVRDRMSLFLAIGPTFGYAHWDYIDIDTAPGRYRESASGSIRRNVGIVGHVGFEWLFTKRLSLAGQFGTTAAYEWGSSDEFYYAEYTTTSGTYQYGGRSRSDVEGVRFRTGRAAFMLSAYF